MARRLRFDRFSIDLSEDGDRSGSSGSSERDDTRDDAFALVAFVTARVSVSPRPKFPRSKGANSRAANTARAASCGGANFFSSEEAFRSGDAPRRRLRTKRPSGPTRRLSRVFASARSPRAPRETLSCPASRSSADATTSAASAASLRRPGDAGVYPPRQRVRLQKVRGVFTKLARGRPSNLASSSVGASSRDVASSAAHALPPKNSASSTSGGVFARVSSRETVLPSDAPFRFGVSLRTKSSATPARQFVRRGPRRRGADSERARRLSRLCRSRCRPPPPRAPARRGARRTPTRDATRDPSRLFAGNVVPKRFGRRRRWQ